MSLIDNNWNFKIDIFSAEEQCYLEFEDKLKEIDVRVLDLFDCSFLNKVSFKSKISQEFDFDLKSIVEQNKQLKDDIDSKVKELETHQTQYENFKQDRKLLSQEVKDTHEALLMAKKYYKKYLKLYYTLESVQNDTQKILIQFFTETRRASDNYSVWVIRDMKTGRYELTSMAPKLNTYKEIQKKLQDTNDIPGALSCIRQSFFKIKLKK